MSSIVHFNNTQEGKVNILSQNMARFEAIDHSISLTMHLKINYFVFYRHT